MIKTGTACLTLLAAALAGCASPGSPEVELTQEQVCLAHFENDPVERDRCRRDPKVRGDTVPDVQPLDLPIRTGQIGD
ncbi:MAG: hypothetical protein R3C46_08850 [Hyphomonadaceae bacterium]